MRNRLVFWVVLAHARMGPLEVDTRRHDRSKYFLSANCRGTVTDNRPSAGLRTVVLMRFRVIVLEAQRGCVCRLAYQVAQHHPLLRLCSEDLCHSILQLHIGSRPHLSCIMELMQHPPPASRQDRTHNQPNQCQKITSLRVLGLPPSRVRRQKESSTDRRNPKNPTQYHIF